MAPDNKKPQQAKAYDKPTLDKQTKLIDVTESGPVVISGIIINGANP